MPALQALPHDYDGIGTGVLRVHTTLYYQKPASQHRLYRAVRRGLSARDRRRPAALLESCMRKWCEEARQGFGAFGLY